MITIYPANSRKIGKLPIGIPPNSTKIPVHRLRSLKSKRFVFLLLLLPVPNCSSRQLNLDIHAVCRDRGLGVGSRHGNGNRRICRRRSSDRRRGKGSRSSVDRSRSRRCGVNRRRSSIHSSRRGRCIGISRRGGTDRHRLARHGSSDGGLSVVDGLHRLHWHNNDTLSLELLTPPHFGLHRDHGGFLVGGLGSLVSPNLDTQRHEAENKSNKSVPEAGAEVGILVRVEEVVQVLVEPSHHDEARNPGQASHAAGGDHADETVKTRAKAGVKSSEEEDKDTEVGKASHRRKEESVVDGGVEWVVPLEISERKT